MRPVCIAGMHRSGTSLMARLLNLGGLYLGEPDDLLPASQTNPDGHWEHEGLMLVNERLLATFGGGWDFPVEIGGFEHEASVGPISESASAHVSKLAVKTIWGWKDPRNSLTLPFWRKLLGDIAIVWCVRHPLEVALSLRARNGSTIAFGLALWTAYNEALKRATAQGGAVVCHYERFQADPAGEVIRVGNRIGLSPTADMLARIRTAVRPELRHNRFSAGDLLDAGVSLRVRRLYHELCLHAGEQSIAADLAKSADLQASHDGPAQPVGRFDYVAMERLRRR